MTKLLIIFVVIIGTAVVEVFVDRAVGIDLSHLSLPKRIIHGVVYKLTGGAIAATIWFT